MKKDSITIEIKRNECAKIGALQEMLFSDMKKIIVTLTDKEGKSSKYAMHDANELEDAPQNSCLVFFMRDGNLYQGYLKSIEEDDNMIVVKTIEGKFAFGLPLSGLLGWINTEEPIKEETK
ncbi:MAG: hypothetical protein IJQ32_03305 [Paludibacteraceae bacterium]|nr:hypothetical protein [Paludibacteraceae bacterium]